MHQLSRFHGKSSMNGAILVLQVDAIYPSRPEIGHSALSYPTRPDSHKSQ